MIGEENLRTIPSVERLFNSPQLKMFSERIGCNYITTIVRHKVEEFRKRMTQGEGLNPQQLLENTVAVGYSRLQIDEEGRQQTVIKIRKLLEVITGAVTGMIVNNNAGATILILNTRVCNKKVIRQYKGTEIQRHRTNLCCQQMFVFPGVYLCNEESKIYTLRSELPKNKIPNIYFGN